MSFREQKKIIIAFLESPNCSDADWAARQAGLYWDKSFIKPLKRLCDIRLSPPVAKTIIKHFPLDFVSLHRWDLHFRCEEELCIRLGDESDFSVESYNLPIFSYLYAYAHLKKEMPKTEEEIEQEVFFHIYKKIVRAEENNMYGPGFNFTDFPDLRKAVWALGKLKMSNIVLKILACQEYILANKNDNTWAESVRLARKWIEEVWDIEDKQFLSDFVATYKEQDLANNMALYDLPPNDYELAETETFLKF